MPRLHDSIKNPGQILANTPGTLRSLLDHARQLLWLQQEVRSLVPGNIFVAACEDGCLHLVTPSSALATRIKYNQRKLVASLRSGGQKIARIRISVRPDYIQTRPSLPRATNAISPENARHMASAAQYIEDEDLRKALIRLSNRASASNSSE